MRLLRLALAATSSVAILCRYLCDRAILFVMYMCAFAFIAAAKPKNLCNYLNLVYTENTYF